MITGGVCWTSECRADAGAESVAVGIEGEPFLNRGVLSHQFAVLSNSALELVFVAMASAEMTPRLHAPARPLRNA